MGHLLRPGPGMGAHTGTALNGLSVGIQLEEQMAWGPLAGDGGRQRPGLPPSPAKLQSPLFLGEEAP